MNYGFLASANSITSRFYEQNLMNKAIEKDSGLSEDLKEKFGSELEAAYDSLTSTKLLSSQMRQSHDASHEDSCREHANRLGYSIDNRVIDMLHIQLSDDMNAKVTSAMNIAVENLLKK